MILDLPTVFALLSMEGEKMFEGLILAILIITMVAVLTILYILLDVYDSLNHKFRK
jgi:hypothetical protein